MTKELLAIGGLLLMDFCAIAAAGEEREPAGDPAGACSEARTFLRVPEGLSKPAGAVRLEIGTRMLFLDNGVLARLEKVEFKVRQPKKYGAVIRADRPWEGTIQIRTAPSWHPEQKLWMIWYMAAGGTAYATSKDGIHWEKPVLGLRDYKGSKENNLLADGLSYVVYDPDDSDPARRYKAFVRKQPLHLSGSGFYPAVSGEGLHWTVLEHSFVPSSDEANLFHDPKRKLFVLTVKHAGPYGRSVYLALSRDFEHWTDPRDCLIFHADKRDQDLARKRIEERFADPAMQHPEYNIPAEYNVDVYNMAVFRYGQTYVGLPALFHQSGRVPKDWDGFNQLKLSPDILSAVRLYGDWTGFHHLQLLSSGDLVNWQRVGGRQPFPDASPVSDGVYDLQTIMPASPPIVRGDELWFYYTGIKRYAYITSGQPDQAPFAWQSYRWTDSFR